MSFTLSVSDRVKTSAGRLLDADTGATVFARYGTTPLPDVSLDLAHGTGSGYANAWYLAQRALAATTYDLLDLAGGLTAFNGSTLTFTKIKRVLVAIVSPDGSKKVRVGPQNQSNPFVGPWGGTGATVYREVVYCDDMKHPYAGWTVTAGTGDILPIYNPGASSVTYCIWIIGEI